MKKKLFFFNGCFHNISDPLFFLFKIKKINIFFLKVEVFPFINDLFLPTFIYNRTEMVVILKIL